MGCDGKKIKYLFIWRRIANQENLRKHIADELKKYKPDILNLIEIDKKSFLKHKKFINQIKKELKLKYSIEKIKYHFIGNEKFLNKIPILNNQENSIISKFKIIEHKFFYFKEGFKKAIIKATIKCPKKISIFLVHLSLNKLTRQKQLKELSILINNTKEPIILAGDFNTFNGENELKNFKKLTKLKHTNHNRTFPTCYPRKIFDYILTSKEIKIKNYQTIKIPFSDHLPVMIDFEVK